MAKTTSLGNKYGNKKRIVNGVKFDSNLELYLYEMLSSCSIEFEFQKSIELQPKFRYNGEAIRVTTIVVDFVLENDGIVYYIDTKGFPTETSKLKYKLLKYKLMNSGDTRVVWLKNKKQVIEFINQITKQNG